MNLKKYFIVAEGVLLVFAIVAILVIVGEFVFSWLVKYSVFLAYEKVVKSILFLLLFILGVILVRFDLEYVKNKLQS